VDEHGLVKVLDFGLAKLAEWVESDGLAPTETLKKHTEEGTIIGTTAYMSPEQAQGKRVDACSDIFSFGAVLYEMVTSRRAFQGDSKLSTLAAIINQEPAPLPAEIPHDLEKLITRCLRKDPERRFQHMDDVKVALEELKEESDSGRLLAAASRATQRWRFSHWAVALGAGALLAAAGLWLWRTRAEAPAVAFVAVPLTTYTGMESQPSFSPDGNQVAFVWDGAQQDNFDIYIKQIGTENLLRLTRDPAVDSSPAWSPDGRHVAFLRALPGNSAGVFLVPTIGGPERKLAETYLPSFVPEPFLGWSPDGKWLAITHRSSAEEPFGLFLLSIETGEKRRLTSPLGKKPGDSAPAFSPNGRSLAFARTASPWVSDLYLLTFGGELTPRGEPRRLTFHRRWATSPAWTPDGREIVFSSGGARGTGVGLWRTPASGSRNPRPLLFAGEQGDQPAISRQGNRLAYTRHLLDNNIWRLELHGPNGKAGSPIPVIASTRTDENPQYSPDGKRIAFISTRSGSHEVWVSASDGSDAVQLTSMRAPITGSPRWCPDGERIAFDSNAEGRFAVYVISASGGRPRRMTNSSADDALPSYSRNGRWIYFASNRTGAWQIWKLPVEGGEAMQATRQGGRVPFESPSGQSVYYAKDVWDTSLWKVPVGGDSERQVLESVRWLGFAPVEKGIYFIPKQHPDGSSSIQFLDLAAGTISTIARIEKPLAEGLSVSPDERHILYTQRDEAGSDLMLIENFR
jgi:Tol biopolymer transport system component